MNISFGNTNRIFPPVCKNLLIINGIVWLATMVLERGGIDLVDYLGLHYFASQQFGIWQLLTYQFMHANLGHIFFNMFAVWMFGTQLERFWGSKKFLWYYLLTGIGAGITQELVWMLQYQPMLDMTQSILATGPVTIGASGAVFGLLLAFGWCFPEERIFLLFIPIPIPARIFVGIYAAIELFEGVASFSGDNVAHYAHLGGLLFGCLILLCWKYEEKHQWRNFMEWCELKWLRLKSRIDGYKEEQKNKHTFHYQPPIRDKKKTSSAKESDKEINRLLDKIKTSGYDSLTDEEKKHLFKR